LSPAFSGGAFFSNKIVIALTGINTHSCQNPSSLFRRLLIHRRKNKPAGQTAHLLIGRRGENPAPYFLWKQSREGKAGNEGDDPVKP
jgi:hypothetical protein